MRTSSHSEIALVSTPPEPRLLLSTRPLLSSKILSSSWMVRNWTVSMMDIPSFLSTLVTRMPATSNICTTTSLTLWIMPSLTMASSLDGTLEEWWRAKWPWERNSRASKRLTVPLTTTSPPDGLLSSTTTTSRAETFLSKKCACSSPKSELLTRSTTTEDRQSADSACVYFQQ